MRRITIMYFILIHIILLIILVKSDFIDYVERRFWLEKAEKYQTLQHYHEMLAYHKSMDGNITESAIIFIGDSMTQGLAVSAISPNSVNFGIGNDTSIGVLRRIGEYKSIERSKMIVVAIGTNDLKVGRTKEEILHSFEEIIKQISSKKMVIFNSIHPVDEESQNNKYRKNKLITSTNDGLEEICSKYPNVHFLNTFNELSNDAGNLRKSYHVGDGVHLSTAGYKVWINLLREKISDISTYGNE